MKSQDTKSNLIFIWKFTSNNFCGWYGILLLFIISALTYLPHVNDLNFYRDDWYYIVDGFTGGAGIFHTMFAIDRPARGYLFEWIFSLFGLSPLPYHLSTFLWRFLSGITSLWLFRLLWPAQKQATFWMAVLFTIYPGYLWWISGVEYQPMIISVFLQTLSIALSLISLKSQPMGSKILAGFGALISGWLYIFLVDYAAGMEAMRYLCIYIFYLHENGYKPFQRQILYIIRKTWIYITIPAGYLIWNLFFFQNQRPETDIVRHFHGLFADPLSTIANWMVSLVQSLLNTGLFSWFIPFSQNFFALHIRNLSVGLLIAMITFICIFLIGTFAKDKNEFSGIEGASADQNLVDWQREAFWLGFLGVLFGALPIVIANRVIVFDAYSHYTLPASLAASVMIIGLVYMIKQPFYRYCIVICLVMMAVLTHYSIGEKALIEEQKVQEFWWQMTWRTSGMKEGTTILANFPGIYQGEEKDIVWGPANLIFAPHFDESVIPKYPITAVPINSETTKKILAGGGDTWNFRSHSGDLDYGKLLFLSQPTSSSCVHAMDSRWPRLTRSDNDQALILSYYSNINTLLVDGENAQPIDSIFGVEPPHEWCYYYQKAEAALQNENWQEVRRIADEAESLDLRPEDRSEWMPFLQAAAYLGETEQMEGYSTIINEDPFLRRNACYTLRAMDTDNVRLQPEYHELAEKLFCHGY